MFFLPTKSWKNHPKKLHTYGSWEFFFSAAPTAQNSPELHFRFINSFIQSSLLRSLKVPFWNLLIFKGTSLSIEKLASLFLFYATCCVASLIILLMEILYKPAKPTIEKINERPFTQHDFNLQLEALQKNLEWLAAKNGKQILGNVKSLVDDMY